MTNEDFENSRNVILKRCIAETNRKGPEYASDDNRLRNFEEIAAVLNISPAQVAYTFFHKHLNSIQKYVLNPDFDGVEDMTSRFADAINYLIFVNCCIQKAKNSEKK